MGDARGAAAAGHPAEVAAALRILGEGGNAEGRKRADALLALSDKHGLRISGPNCMGSVALREKLLFYPAKRVRTLRPGPVGVRSRIALMSARRTVLSAT